MRSRKGNCERKSKGLQIEGRCRFKDKGHPHCMIVVECLVHSTDTDAEYGRVFLVANHPNYHRRKI